MAKHCVINLFNSEKKSNTSTLSSKCTKFFVQSSSLLPAKNKNCKIKDINTLDNLDNVKIFWNNLRKPIIINSSNYSYF